MSICLEKFLVLGVNKIFFGMVEIMDPVLGKDQCINSESFILISCNTTNN